MKLLDAEQASNLRDQIVLDAVTECKTDIAATLVALANELLGHQTRLGGCDGLILECNKKQAKSLAELVIESIAGELPCDVKEICESQDGYDNLTTAEQENVISRVDSVVKQMVSPWKSVAESGIRQ